MQLEQKLGTFFAIVIVIGIICLEGCKVHVIQPTLAKIYNVKIVRVDRFGGFTARNHAVDTATTTLEFPNGIRKVVEGALGDKGETIKYRIKNDIGNSYNYHENLGEFAYEKEP